ncbi:MAG: FAD-dependent oxidoreductase [Fusicatenibacter sp.]|nr:FAD-dependent oxidoreductase [Fusicatenibacter sp.]
MTLNMTNAIGIDGTNAEDLTKGYIRCRKQIPQILSFLREHVPGYENCYLIKTGSQLGVRETRHFKGLKTITEEDIRQARVFEDWAVTRAHFNFDVHNITGAGLDETGEQKGFTQRHGYTIPYGCFVPVKIDGLLLAGRIISGTHMAHSNFRVMPICANMGQAVGVAAALCCKKHCQPRELPVRELQQSLRKWGVEP